MSQERLASQWVIYSGNYLPCIYTGRPCNLRNLLLGLYREKTTANNCLSTDNPGSVLQNSQSLEITQKSVNSGMSK